MNAAWNEFADTYWDLELELSVAAGSITGTCTLEELEDPDDTWLDMLARAVVWLTYRQFVHDVQGLELPFDWKSIIKAAPPPKCKPADPEERSDSDIEADRRMRMHMLGGMDPPGLRNGGGSSAPDTRSWWQKAWDWAKDFADKAWNSPLGIVAGVVVAVAATALLLATAPISIPAILGAVVLGTIAGMITNALVGGLDAATGGVAVIELAVGVAFFGDERPSK